MRLSEINSRDVITEGLSDILYHSTSLRSAYSIVKNNEFKLTSDMGMESEQQYRKSKDSSYYLSTARSKTGSYHLRDYYAQGHTLFVLDGRKLSANHAGGAIDYWSSGRRAAGSSEMEDRVYSNSPTISPALKFIQEIHIILTVDHDKIPQDDTLRLGRIIKISAARANIPVYFYNDVTSFNQMNTGKSVRLSDYKLSNYQSIGNSNNTGKSKTFVGYMELLNIQDQSKLSSRARDILHNMTGFYANEQLRSLIADVGNTKRSDHGRREMEKFIAALAKKKIYTLKDFVKYVKVKFPN
jgi:hypothetical protein